MKIILLILCLFAVAASVFGQRKETSICAGTADTKAVLTICDRGKGMHSFFGLQLFLRVYPDGRAEYEKHPPATEGHWEEGQRLIKQTFKIDASWVAEIVKLGDAKDFQEAKADYPVFRIWTDSGLETAIVYRDQDNNYREKKVVVHNYMSGDENNYNHYPTSLVTLLSLAEELRTGKKRVPKFTAYDGRLEVGDTYRGQVNFDDAYGMRLTAFPRLPYHHSVMYSWPNVKDFPALDADKGFGARWVVFKVVDKKIARVDKNRWTTTFTMQIVEVE
jgi:hypothetical protein